MPLKLNLPEELTLDEKSFDINSVRTELPIYLDEIVCGSQYSGLIASNGGLWLCGNMKPASKKKDDEEEKLVQLTKDEDISDKLQ